jgi:dihydrofolate reductase
MVHFKRTTLGCPVIMGRKTWDSLPVRFRPLPGRLNVVVTRQTDWATNGAVVAHSIEAACAACPPDSTAWVIGGAEIYAQALPLASTAVVTELADSFEGDAFAPAFGPDWVETERHSQTSTNGLHFSFVTYQKQ